uniref:Uncharacterized protein n=1 Tax=Rhizophora mucronata TaxID=61149 RepID=A0A2P2NCH7_RHIMU
MVRRSRRGFSLPLVVVGVVVSF